MSVMFEDSSNQPAVEKSDEEKTEEEEDQDLTPTAPTEPKEAISRKRNIKVSDETPLRRSERIKMSMANYIELFTTEPLLMEDPEDL